MKPLLKELRLIFTEYWLLERTDMNLERFLLQKV